MRKNEQKAEHRNAHHNGDCCCATPTCVFRFVPALTPTFKSDTLALTRPSAAWTLAHPPIGRQELHGLLELRNAFFPAEQHVPLPRSLPYPAELTRILQSLLPGRPAIADCLHGRSTAEALSAVRAELQALLSGHAPPDACAAPPRPTR